MDDRTREALAAVRFARRQLDQALEELSAALTGQMDAEVAQLSPDMQAKAADAGYPVPRLVDRPEPGTVAAKAADFLGPLRNVNDVRGAMVRLAAKEHELGAGIYAQALTQLAARALDLPVAERSRIGNTNLRRRIAALSDQRHADDLADEAATS